MSEQAAKTKTGFSAEWVIKDKDGNIKDQGSEGREGEEAEK
jgi:hypothetical protein